MLRACIYTLGCRVNQYESDAIATELKENGVEIVDSSCECDICIINTCTVTGESDRKSKQIIRRLINKNPCATVIVTGCYSQINPKEALDIEGVDYVCGNNGKSTIAKKALEIAKAKAKEKELYLPDLHSGCFDKMFAGAPLSRTRAFIKIQDGCDSKCAYCIIPQARGSVRSSPPEHVLSEARNIAQKGVKEIVFTGIETASYGKDFKNRHSLGDLLTEANKIEGLKRIRLGSLDPSQINEEFVKRISALDKVMPHFHISMQSGCTKTLNEMKRKYNIDMAKKSIELLRAHFPRLQLSADVITGFPNESDADFEQTLEFFKEQRFLHLHIFPYSKRSGTAAAQMKNQVPDTVKKERLHKLQNQQKEIKREILEKIVQEKKPLSVLFESYDGECALGHTPEFIEVKIKSPLPLGNELINVMPTHTDGEYIIADKI